MADSDVTAPRRCPLRIVKAMVLVSAFSACTAGDGEGARYIGRVVSVSPSEVCVGPSSSSSAVMCGAVPKGVERLPQVGHCVGLFPSKLRDGKVATWSAASLQADYADKCGPQ